MAKINGETLLDVTICCFKNTATKKKIQERLCSLHLPTTYPVCAPPFASFWIRPCSNVWVCLHMHTFTPGVGQAREFVIALCKALSTTKIYSKETDSSTSIGIYPTQMIVCGCLINVETVSGELVIAMCRHFGTLISS